MLSRCECLDGYEQINDTHCEDRDECAFQPNLCAPYGSCSNTEGSYKCICRGGFRNVDGACVGQWHFRYLEFDVKYLILRYQLNKKWSTQRVGKACLESIVAMALHNNVYYGVIYKFLCRNGHYFIKRTN